MAKLTAVWKRSWKAIDKICRRNRDHLKTELELDEKDREVLSEALMAAAYCMINAPNNHISVGYEHERNTAPAVVLRINVDGVGVIGIGRKSV